MSGLGSVTPPLVCLIRHGETAYAEARRYNGTTDIALTAGGELAAASLRPVLARVGWDRVFCSDLSRAQRTAQLAGFATPELLVELRECDYGDFEGRTTEEILAACPGWDFWADGCPNGERAEDVAARLRPVVERLRGLDGRTLVFSHSHAIRILAATMLGLDPRLGSIFSLEPARISAIRIHRGRPELALWNETA